MLRHRPHRQARERARAARAKRDRYSPARPVPTRQPRAGDVHQRLLERAQDPHHRAVRSLGRDRRAQGGQRRRAGLPGERQVDRDLLVRAIRYALERNRMLVELDGFAHTVSHDLRGPLTAMKLSGETLQKIVAAPPNEKTAHSINELTRIIVDNVDKSSVLIKDLLDLAEAGQTPKDLEVVDVRETVDRVLEETGLGVGDRELTLEIDDDLGTIRANRTHVYQVFQNLVGNAISHNDNLEPTVVISYLGEDDQGRHKYRVCLLYT